MNSFSFQRWSLLVGKHWIENQKRYLLSVLAIFALLIFFFTFFLLTGRYDPISRSTQIIGYFLGLFGIGCLYAGQYFSPLGNKSKGAYFLLTPATAFEKLLCALLYVVVIFFTVYTAVYYLADTIMISIANVASPSYLNPDVNGVVQKASLINVFYEYNWGLSNANLLYYLLLAFFAVQSVFLLGSIYFNQYGIVKTGIVLFAGFLFVFFLEGYLLHTFLPKGNHDNALTNYVTFTDGHFDKLVQLSPWIGSVIGFLLQFSIAPLMWMVTYFRLTEKEI